MTTEIREVVTKLIETFQPYADSYETHGLIAEATRALHKEPCSSAPTPKVLVGQGVLTMVLNALRRDAEAGREVRGEMANELIKTIEYPDLKAALEGERARILSIFAQELECSEYERIDAIIRALVDE